MGDVAVRGFHEARPFHDPLHDKKEKALELESILLEHTVPLHPFTADEISKCEEGPENMTSSLLPNGSLLVVFQAGDWAHGFTAQMVFHKFQEHWAPQSVSIQTYTDVAGDDAYEGELLDPRWWTPKKVPQAYPSITEGENPELVLRLQVHWDSEETDFLWAYRGAVDLDPALVTDDDLHWDLALAR